MSQQKPQFTAPSKSTSGRKKRSKAKIFLAVVGVFLALGIVGNLMGDPKPDKPTVAANKPATDAPAPKKAAQPAPAKPAPKPVDTGRMSGSEYESFVSYNDRFRKEASEYGAGLGGKCAAMADAGQMSEFFDCENDAYDGVMGSWGLANDTYKELLKATAKECAASLKSAHKAFGNFGDIVAGTHDQASNGKLGDATVVQALVKLTSQRKRAYLKTFARAKQRCKPA